MGILLSISRMIDAVTRFIGYNVRWLILAAVLVSAGNAIIRKAFDSSSNAWLELQWLLFGAVFMLAAAYTLQVNAHVRIDVVSSRLSKRTRDIIDAVWPHPHAGTPRGHHDLAFDSLLLGQLHGWRDVHQCRRTSRSGQPSSWCFAGFVLLLLQMASELIKRIAVLMGVIADPEPQAVHGHAPGDTAVGGGHNE